MTPIRTNNLYISSQLHRWLKWMADMEAGEAEGFIVTQDSKAEQILRDHILANYPSIEQLEHDYWTARNKLDSKTVNKLKEQTAKTDKPM